MRIAKKKRKTVSGGRVERGKKSILRASVNASINASRKKLL